MTNRKIYQGCLTSDDVEKKFNFNDYMLKHRPFDRYKEYPKLIPRIYCADGFHMSVQASRFAYCSPRESTDYYYKVEVGFPSEKCDELTEYAENPEEPTQTVYGWVPVEVVEALVEKHGGLKENQNEQND